MAIPVIETGWTKASSGSGTPTSIDVAEPTGVTSGDMLIVIAGSDAIEAGPNWDDTTTKPTGFTLIGTYGNATAKAHVAAFYRISDGTEGDPLTVPQAAAHNLYVWYLRITHADGFDGDSINIFGGGTEDSDVATHVIPGVTSTENNGLAIYAFAFDGGDGDPFSVSGTGWSEFDEQEAGTGGGAGAGAIGTKDMTTAGATGDATIDITANDDASAFMQFVIVPAAAGAGTSVGTSATTNANDSSAGVGDYTAVASSGTSATTNANDSSAGVGAYTATPSAGTSATTNTDDASAASGFFVLAPGNSAGTSATTNADDVSAGTGINGVILYGFETPTTLTRGLELDARPRFGDKLFKVGAPVGYTVLIESGVATPYPGMSAPPPNRIRNADAYFGGGRNHTVTEAQKTILEAAGYTVG